MIVGALLFAASNASCSLVLVDGPPPPRPLAGQIECTTGRVAPIVDTVVAITQVLRIAYAGIASDAEYDELGLKISRGWDVATGAALLGLFGTSAVVGYSRVSDCRKAKAEELENAEIVRRQQRQYLLRKRQTVVPSPPETDATETADAARPATDAGQDHADPRGRDQIRATPPALQNTR